MCIRDRPTPVCCPDFTISIGNLGFETLSVNDFDCGSTDICTSQDALNVSISQSMFTIDDIGANDVIITVEDECGNVSTCMTTVTVVQDPSIGISKRVVDVVNNADGSSVVTYELNVVNYGDVDLTNVQVQDDLNMTFPSPCNINVESISSTGFIENLNYNGISDINLLTGNNNLPIGGSASIIFSVTVMDCNTTGPFMNTATVEGLSLIHI